MLAEGEPSTADPTSEHGSTQSPPEASRQVIGEFLPGVQQSETLLAVPQGSLLNTTYSNLARAPDAQALVTLDNALNPITLSEWSWKEPSKISQQTAFSPGVMDESALLWNRSPAIPTTTPPREVEPEYQVDHLYPVDDSAQFWTQESGVIQVTPPHDDLAFADLDISTMLHPYPSTISIFPPEHGNIDTYRPQNLETAFNSNSEQLSIPMGYMVGDGSNNPPTTMCPTI